MLDSSLTFAANFHMARLSNQPSSASLASLSRTLQARSVTPQAGTDHLTLTGPTKRCGRGMKAADLVSDRHTSEKAPMAIRMRQPGTWQDSRASDLRVTSAAECPMRTLILAGLCMTSIAAAPALAQVQPGNPNAANQSMGASSQMRTQQQEQTTQSNTARMNSQRNEAATPAPSTSPNAIAPSGGRPGLIGR